jgi:hypothetical protein
MAWISRALSYGLKPGSGGSIAIPKLVSDTTAPRDFLRDRIPSVTRYCLDHDFPYPSGTTLPANYTAGHVGTTPTHDYVTDAVGGVYALKLDTGNEVQVAYLSGNDKYLWLPSNGLRMVMILKVESDVTGGGGSFAAGDKFVAGFASARNDNPDTVTTSAWFMFAGANHNIYVETDDDSTNNDDNDTGVDWVENTYVCLEIDMTTLASVKFYVNQVDVTPETMTMAGASAAQLQPFIQVSKAAAANKDHRVSIDYIGLSSWRTGYTPA